MTVYYIDLTNGLDTNDGLGTGTAWLTLSKYMVAARTVGDIAWVRNLGTQVWATASDMSVVSDGNIQSPIVIKNDDGSKWTADETALTNTYTVTPGSDAVVASATESQLVVGKQVRFGSERLLHEVLTVSGVNITIWPPYLGELSGAGKAGVMLPNKPVLSLNNGLYSLVFSSDNNWIVKGLEVINGTDAGIKVISSHNVILNYITFQNFTGSGSGLIWDRTLSLQNSRFFNCNSGLSPSGAGKALLDNVLFDGNNQAASAGLRCPAGIKVTYILNNVIFKNHAAGDIKTAGANSIVWELIIKGRKVDLQSTTKISAYRDAAANTTCLAEIAIEDYGGVVGDNRVFSYLDETEGVPTLQSDTGTVRAGGADKSVKCTGSSRISPEAEDATKVLLFEAMYYQTAMAKTYTVYFNLPAAEFTAAPTAAELFLELEFFEASARRRKKRSTGTVLADGNWNSLTVSGTNAVIGQVYLRGYYCKTKESGKTNVFYADPLAVVS